MNASCFIVVVLDHTVNSQTPELKHTSGKYLMSQRTPKKYVTVILIALIAFGAGLVVSPYLSSLPLSINPQYVTVTTTASATFSQMLFSSTSSQLHASSTSGGKWIGSTQTVVSWSQAANYAGQSVTVEGTIVCTYVSSKGTVFLDFHNPYQGYFDAVIFSSDTANFNFSPASFYLNKEVRITSTIQMYNGAPEIIVHTPSQIEVAYMGFNYP